MRSACVRAPKGAASGARTFGRSYVKPGSPAVFNELVEYRSARVVAEILTAARHLLKRCPSVDLKVSTGVFARIRFSWPMAAHLLRGAFAIHEVISGTVSGHKYRSNPLFGIYQAEGRILSLVFGGGKTVAATHAAVLHAAQESARNLR